MVVPSLQSRNVAAGADELVRGGQLGAGVQDGLELLVFGLGVQRGAAMAATARRSSAS
jgi:hypothetical protein